MTDLISSFFSTKKQSILTLTDTETLLSENIFGNLWKVIRVHTHTHTQTQQQQWQQFMNVCLLTSTYQVITDSKRARKHLQDKSSRALLYYTVVTLHLAHLCQDATFLSCALLKYLNSLCELLRRRNKGRGLRHLSNLFWILQVDKIQAERGETRGGGPKCRHMRGRIAETKSFFKRKHKTLDQDIFSVLPVVLFIHLDCFGVSCRVLEVSAI